MSEYDDDYYDEEDDEPEVTYLSDTRPASLDFRIRQKIIDLQNQLIMHYQKVQLLNETDLVRYTAMVEVLKAMLN